MVANDNELRGTWDRIAWLQNFVFEMRKTELSPTNYRASASGFLAEIERMQRETNEYLKTQPRADTSISRSDGT